MVWDTIKQIPITAGLGDKALAALCCQGVLMMRSLCTTALLFSFAAISHANDNLKAFPPADQGMTRYVLELPKQRDESSFKVELIIGKTVQNR
jgi:serine protease inhibitor ecotin